jgi:hypothetical protein
VVPSLALFTAYKELIGVQGHFAVAHLHPVLDRELKQFGLEVVFYSTSVIIVF